MTPTHDPDPILSAWLDEGPTDLPDNTRRAIVAALPTTGQRRRPLWAPRRFDLMTSMQRTAIAVLVAAVALVGGIYLLGSNNGPATTPEPSPTATTSVLPSASANELDTTSWTTFTSDFNGFSARYPTDYEATPATKAGAFAEISQSVDPTVFDHFAPVTGTYPVFDVTSTALGDMTADAWIAQYRQPTVDQFGEECFPPREDWEPVTIDGETDGGLYTGCAYVEAELFVAGRVYIFTIFLGLGTDATQESRDFLRAFTSTVELHPELARNPTSAAAFPAGVLVPGTYISGTFSPPVILSVGDGWDRWIEDSDVLALRHGGVTLAFTLAAGPVDEAHLWSYLNQGPDESIPVVETNYGNAGGLCADAVGGTIFFDAASRAYDPEPGDIGFGCLMTFHGAPFGIKAVGQPDVFNAFKATLVGEVLPTLQ